MISRSKAGNRLLLLPEEQRIIAELGSSFSMGLTFKRAYSPKGLTLGTIVEETGQCIVIPDKPYLLVPDGDKIPSIVEATAENWSRYSENTGTYRAMTDFLLDLAAGKNNELIVPLLLNLKREYAAQTPGR